MSNLKRGKVLSFMMILFCLLAMVLFRDELMATIMLAIAVIALFLLWTRIDGMLHQEIWKRSMNEQLTVFIRTFNHHRHDWMNDLQVIVGYITLKKYDKLTDCVERIRMKLAQENKITKLGDASLSLFLLSFRIQCNVMELDVDVEGEVDLSKLPIHSPLLNELIRNVVDQFRMAAKPSNEEPNRLTVKFKLSDDRLLLDFEYNGMLHYEELALGLERTLQEERKAMTELEYQVNVTENSAQTTVKLTT